MSVDDNKVVAQNAENGANGAEPEKKKAKGKPKDLDAPPKPRGPFVKFGIEARPRLKEQNPALQSDLSGMCKALAEGWAAVSEEKKAKMQEEYEKEMAVWKPLWAAYKLTDHYNDFVEVKTDYLDKKQRKKQQKVLTKDAPKRPKSGYMIFGSEIREKVMEKVKAENLGLAAAGQMISAQWSELSEAQKAKYGEQSVQQKKVFDVEFAKYRMGDSFKSYVDAKAKLEAKQGLKKILRTHMGKAPKKAASAFAIFRNEHLPKICEENSKAAAGEKLAMGDIARKVAKMWKEVPEDQKKPYTDKANQYRDNYMKDMTTFKTKKLYTDFLESREKIKAKENKLVQLRDMPARPKSVFSLFADDHKTQVPPGKGEGKGRNALKTLWTDADGALKEKYVSKEKELKDLWMKELEDFKAGPKFKTFNVVNQKIRDEFVTDASKVVTMRWLADAPAAPAKTAFALFLNEKRKAKGIAEGEKLSKEAKRDEVGNGKKEFAALDKTIKAEYENRKKEGLFMFEKQCKEYMQSPKYLDYVKEAKRMKLPVKSLLLHQKKVMKKLEKGMKRPPSSIPLPSRPDLFPERPRSAMQHYTSEKKGTMGTLEEIAKSWAALDADGKKVYTTQAEDDQKRFDTEMKEFKSSDDGKKYIRDLNTAQRNRRLLAAKNKYLDDLPKKPDGAIKTFQLERLKKVKSENPGKKGFELKQILQNAWKGLSDEERTKINDDANTRQTEFQEKMRLFKESANWINFLKMTKAKASAKGGGGPKVPESMPKKPLGGFQTWMKEVSGKYKSLKEYADAYKTLDAEKKDELEKAAKERDAEYKTEFKKWNESPEAKKWVNMKQSFTKNKALRQAKEKFLKGQPKKPPNAFALFSEEKKAGVQGKGSELSTKLIAMWKELSADDKDPFVKKEKESMEAFNKEMAEFKSSDNYKKYESIAKRGSGGGKSAKAKKGAMKGGGGGGNAPPMPDAPDNLPKRPLSAMNLFGKERREGGKSLGLKQIAQEWTALGAEGQKKYVDEAKELSKTYENDMAEFKKSADGKKYFREVSLSKSKGKNAAAKKKFLGGSMEPKRPPSAYFIFVAEKRNTLEKGLKLGEIAKKLTELWKALEPDDKKTYETKASELKTEYDEKMKEYKASPGFQKFQKATTAVKPNVKAAAKAKAGKPAAAKKAGGRGGGGGRGRGSAPKPAGRGRGAAAPAAKKAAGSSDSDVMGSDSDDSSNSSNSDSD